MAWKGVWWHAQAIIQAYELQAQDLSLFGLYLPLPWSMQQDLLDVHCPRLSQPWGQQEGRQGWWWKGRAGDLLETVSVSAICHWGKAYQLTWYAGSFWSTSEPISDGSLKKSGPSIACWAHRSQSLAACSSLKVLRCFFTSSMVLELILDHFSLTRLYA